MHPFQTLLIALSIYIWVYVGGVATKWDESPEDKTRLDGIWQEWVSWAGRTERPNPENHGDGEEETQSCSLVRSVVWFLHAVKERFHVTTNEDLGRMLNDPRPNEDMEI